MGCLHKFFSGATVCGFPLLLLWTGLITGHHALRPTECRWRQRQCPIGHDVSTCKRVVLVPRGAFGKWDGFQFGRPTGNSGSIVFGYIASVMPSLYPDYLWVILKWSSRTNWYKRRFGPDLFRSDLASLKRRQTRIFYLCRVIASLSIAADDGFGK